MGRKKKSPELAKFEGNPGKRPLPETAGKLELSAPEPPDFLGKSGREEWDRIVPGLSAMKVATVLDTGILAAYCTAYETFRYTQRRINELNEESEDGLGGLIKRTAKGNEIQHPLVGIRNRAMSDMRMFGSDIGLTHASSAALVVVAQGKENPFKGLIGGKKK